MRIEYHPSKTEWDRSEVENERGYFLHSSPRKVSPSYFKIRVTRIEMEHIRKQFHLTASELTVKWLCEKHNIDYYHLDRIEVKSDPTSLEADIILTILSRYDDLYRDRIITKPDSPDKPNNKDLLMVRKKRSITLS